MSTEDSPTSTAGRLARSVRERGFWATLVLALAQARIRAGLLRDATFDLARGTETATVVENADLTVVGPHLGHGVRYQPTRADALRRVLDTLQIPRSEVFVDIGCGKGRALMVARDYGFRGLVGIDYAPALCEAARRNLATDRRGSASATPVRIECRDAADYPFAPDEGVIYLFNPFDAHVMERMVANLAASLRAHPRPLWLIYLFPRWHGVIERSGLFERTGVHRHGECEFAVYRTTAAPVS